MTETNTVYEYYYSEIDEPGSDSEISADEEKKNGGDTGEKPEIEHRRTEARSGSLMTIFLLSLMAAAVLGTVIYSLNRRNTMYNRVADKNQELKLAESENVRLQSELEGKISAKNVEEYAENDLGMKKIDPSQIKYIKIQTGDVVNIPEEEEGFGAKIKNFFDKCVEYFRG